MKAKSYFILSLFLCSILHSQDLDVRFTSEPSKNSLGINENLRIDFKMNQDGDNFNAPNFEDFRVVGGPNQSVSNTWVNGKRTFSKVYSYYLTPLKTGKLTIGQATIEINSQVYKTIPVVVDVTESVTISKNPNDPSYLVDENLHLVAEASNISPFLNEGISITYKLFFSPQINVTNVGEIDSPKYSDFWSHNIKIPRLQIERGTYKGKSYNYVIWKKIVLYPQKVGELNVLPLTLDVSVDVPTNKRDFFGNRIYTQVPKTVTAGKREINVLALPKNAPDNFGADVASELQSSIGIPFKEVENHFTRQGSREEVVHLSSALKALAVSLFKIANDIRWMGSGPVSGLGDLKIPALQPGSSIMPGKVNPVIPEMMMQVSAQVIGNDTTITFSSANGNFELNTMLPVMAHNLLESIALLTTGVSVFGEKLIKDLEANTEKLNEDTQKNSILVTALVPKLGYDVAAEVAKEAMENGLTIKDVLLSKELMSEGDIDDLLDIEKLI